MAEIISKETTTTTTSPVIKTPDYVSPVTTTTTSTAETSAPQTIAPVSPVQQVAESSTTEYSRPIETQPTLTYTEAIVSRIPALTSEPTTTDKPTVTAETRPLVVNNLMIDPVAGTTTALTSLGMPQTGGGAVGGGTFGGGGGGGATGDLVAVGAAAPYTSGASLSGQTVAAYIIGYDGATHREVQLTAAGGILVEQEFFICGFPFFVW